MKIRKKAFFAILIGFLVTASGCTNKSDEQTKQQKALNVQTKFEIVEAPSLKVKQIFGIGYPGNDNRLYLAADNGIKMYKDAKWYKTTANNHKYIGFQAIGTGFIASGQPEKGSGLKDRLGLVQSSDKGEALKKMAFYGKNTFHFVGAGYSGDAIYVINEQPNNKLAAGLNYSKNNGATWTESALKDFQADSYGMIAVHPKTGDLIAMSTRSGVYYSTDNGNTMKLITAPFMVTAVTFMGDSLLFSSVENNAILLKSLNPETGEQANMAIPFLDYDNPITYLAVNTKNPSQLAFTTYKNDLYESTDGGKTWVNLLSEGKK